jgi:hypothetical protein
MLFRMLNVLNIYISTFRSLCAVPNMAVFCSSLISCFPGTLLSYCLSDSEMFPATPIFTGVYYYYFIIIIIIISSSRSSSSTCLKLIEHEDAGT